MKINILNGSEVSRLSVAIQITPKVLFEATEHCQRFDCKTMYTIANSCQKTPDTIQKARSDAGLEVLYWFYVQAVARREIIPTQS
ncbi:UNVERIFIED_ORG: hypothetical protein J2Y93_001094 [Pantoea agglomerans]